MAAHAFCEVGDLPLGRMKAFPSTIQDGCQICCPLHRARFDIATGKVVQWANLPAGIQLLDGLRCTKPSW